MKQNVRTSKYNLYFPLSNNKESLLIQGILGSFDIVENKLARLLEEERIEEIESLYGAQGIPDRLLQRGYITEKSQEEEFEFLQKLCDRLLEKSQKSVSITFVLTYNCNFRCEYCCERYVQNKGEMVLEKQLTSEIVDAVFAQVEKFRANGRNVESICLFGGEPLLPQNEFIVCYICEKAAELGIPVFCISNGFFLRQYVPILKKYHVKKVQITLDGNEAEHNKRRYLASGRGTYKTIVNNISYALQEGVCISLRTNINKKNIHQMRYLVDLYAQYGWTALDNFSYYFKATMPCYEALKDVCTDADLIKEIERVFGTENMDKFQLNSVYSSLSRSLRKMLENKGFAPLQSIYCGAGGGMYDIDAFGDIYACNDTLTDSNCIIGTVDIQNGQFVLNENHDKWKKRSVATMPHCKKCPYLLFCGGGCAGQARLSGEKGIYSSYCMDFQNIFRQVAVEVCEDFLSK